MNDMSDKTLKRYYEESESWAADRHRNLRRSRKIAWTVAGVAVGVALLEAIALAALAPLKTVVPYTVLVDRQTGNVQALSPLGKQEVTPDDALVRSFLAQYVTTRESFDINSLRADYRKVALWSTGEARDRYLAGMQASNPQSPLATMPRGAVSTTEILSVSSLSPATALVRFTTTRSDPGAQAGSPEYWAAVITSRFSTSAMSADDRLLNPLGFQVLRYRKNAEMAPAPTVEASLPQPSGAGPVAAPIAQGIPQQSGPRRLMPSRRP
jgi:type IV secretion system protein VirB8